MAKLFSPSFFVVAVLVAMGVPVRMAQAQDERLSVAEGVNTIYVQACQLHCKRRVIDACVHECTEQHFEPILGDEDDPDLDACRRAGGVLRARMYPCAAAMATLIRLDDTSKMSEMLAAMAEVEAACSSEALCDAASAPAKL